MKTETVAAITVRVIEKRKRLRVQEIESGLFVCCPREWRESMNDGRNYRLLAHIKSDRTCFVAANYSLMPEPVTP